MNITPQSSTSTTSFPPFTLISDIEVNKLVDPDITEATVKIFNFFGEKTDYKTAYMRAPAGAENIRTFQKTIPAGCERRELETNLADIKEYIEENTASGESIFMIVYNKEWDEKVWKQNYARHDVDIDWNRIKFIDMAQIARFLGFPYGTTQSRFASNWEEEVIGKAPDNLHRSRADVRLLTLICRRVFKEATNDMKALRAAFYAPEPERSIADHCLRYDPSLKPKPELLAIIEQIKEERSAERKYCTITAFDLETNGLDPKNPEPCYRTIEPLQIAAIAIGPDGNYSQSDVFSTLINPGDKVEIPSEATEVHGITKDQIIGKPTPLQAWDSLRRHVHLSDARRRCVEDYQSKNPDSSFDPDKYTEILFGYNSYNYDLEILKRVLMRRDNEIPRFDLKHAMGYDSIRSFDLYPVILTYFAGVKTLKDRKLTTIAEHYGIPTEGAHDALRDIEIMIEVAKKICEGLNIYTVILEASLFKKGQAKATKEIITYAKQLAASGTDCEKAVKEAVSLYRQKVLRETAEEEEQKQPEVEKKRKTSAPSGNRRKKAKESDEKVLSEEEKRRKNGVVSSQPTQSQPFAFI